MTISSTARIAGPFTGNGVTTTFSFTYKVFSTLDVQVIRLTISTGIETTLTIVTDYTITLNGDQDSNPGGNIVLVTPLLALYKLTATSDIANLQPTDLTNQGGFYPEVITDALDRATIQIQQLADQTDRAIKIPISDGVLDMTTPGTADRASKYFVYDASGLPSVSSGSGTDTALRTDLANASASLAGSRLSGFRQDGTGATARTVDAKLKDTISVNDFGAVGDGVTDDTAAFTNAIASLVSIGCGTLLIPKTANSYRISPTGALSVSNTNGISIVSNGATIACAARSSLSFAVGFITGTNVDNLTVDGLRFVCYDTVSRYGVSGASFDSYCNTADFPGKNPECSAPYFGNLTTIVTNFRYGFLLTDVENVVIKNCYFGNNFFQPINFQSTGSTTLGTGNKNILIENTTFDGANISSIFWEETTNITINNCLWNNCGNTDLDHAIYPFTNTKNLVITNSQTIGGMYGAAFPLGLYGIDTVTINNVLVDNCHNRALYMSAVGSIYVGGNNLGVVKNITVNNFTVVNQTTSLFATAGALITIDQVEANEVGIENVCLSNISIYGSLMPCFSVISHASAASPHTNIVLDGFYFSNANLLNGSYGCMHIAKSTNTVIKNGVILDASRIAGTCEAVITLGVDLTNVLVDNISIINQSRAFNPIGGTAPFCIRSTQTPITGLVQNCNFVNYNAGAINSADIANYNTTLRHKNLVTFGRLGLYFTSGSTNYSQPIIISQPEVTLTADSATPTVQYVTEFVTANTVATSITNFTDGVDGQEITVRVNDANTTFDFTSSSLKGNVGVDFLATSGDVLFAKKQGSNWYCTICNIS